MRLFKIIKVTDMNYGDIKNVDVANGPGVRVSIFVSGCTHHCPGCFNPETWDFNFGKLFTDHEIEKIVELLAPDHIKGLSVLGGEPFERSNQQGLLPLLRKVKDIYPEKDVWCYSGYLFDKEILGDMAKKWPETEEMIKYIDILVDGEFVEAEKNLKLRFRGSRNQRIIDVQKSLKSGTVELWDEPMEI